MQKELYLKLRPYKDLMRQIIINSSASNIPIGYKTTLEEAGKEFGYKLSCNCSSGWFVLTSKVYKEYCAAELLYEQNQNSEENEATTIKRNNKSSKRK